MRNLIKDRSGQTNKATAWTIVGIIVVVTVVVIVAGAYSGGSGNANNTPSGFVATAAAPITSSDWVEGNPKAKVTVIEYGDFECPACGAYFPVMQQLFAAYSSTVLFAFRNYPLTTIHPFAEIGAQAAEAAGFLGGSSKYWAMHDLLYQDQTQWSTDGALTPQQVVSQFFNGYAQSIGLNVSQFDNVINASSVLAKIQNDVNGGNAAQINHTPTFFVDNVQIPNPTGLSDFESVINAALASTTPSVVSSTGSSSSGIATSTGL